MKLTLLDCASLLITCSLIFGEVKSCGIPMYTSIISSKIEISYYRGENAPMYICIIEFFYFIEKYRQKLLFTFIFRGENSISLYFPYKWMNSI